MDTVGAKHMSLYGYHRKTTPNLERIAEDCTVYTRCFAPSCWTIPSHASMFTGLYPSQHGAHEGNRILNDNIQHIVSILKMMGYFTAGISSNPLVSPIFGLCRDFDYFKDFSESYLKRFFFNNNNLDDCLSKALSKGENSFEKLLILGSYALTTGNISISIKRFIDSLNYRLNSPFSNSTRFSKFTTNKAISLINNKSLNHRPCFMFLNFIQAHERYNPPLTHRNFSNWMDRPTSSLSFYHKLVNDDVINLLKRNINLYDDEIYYLDLLLNKLFCVLKLSPDYEDNVIIITSDHGEHFGEKERYGHRLSLYNELIWVPLIIKYPKYFQKFGEDDRLVSLNDIFGTILDLTQSPYPCPETSLSLVSPDKRDVSIAEYIYPEENADKIGFKKPLPILAAMTEKYKIIENRNRSFEIYELLTDMGENINVFDNIDKSSRASLIQLINYIKNITGYENEFEKVLKYMSI